MGDELPTHSLTNDGDDSAFEAIAVNPALRQTFVTNIVGFVGDHDLDGIDIDWEYPDEGASGDGFTALMGELSTQLHGSGKLLTAAVTGSSWGASGVSTEVFGYVDWLNLMAYDGGSGGRPLSLQLRRERARLLGREGPAIGQGGHRRTVLLPPGMENV